MSGRRYLLYSHDAVGLGHTRRSLAIANAVTRDDPSASVLLATGCEALDLFGMGPRVDVLRLPSIRKSPAGEYVARRLDLDQQAIRGLRGAVLSAAVDAFRPDVLLADKHPAGAGGELVAALVRHRAHGGRLALGFRDILDEPGAVQAEWERTGARRAMADYDEIFVYGDPRVVDHRVAYGLRPGIDPAVRYCGYVVEEAPASGCPRSDAPGGRPRVLATAGGGEDGERLLRTFVAAAASADWDAHVVIGPMADTEDGAELAATANRHGVTAHGRVPGLGSRLGEFDALVTMGGYNTLVEAVASGTPTVCVPRVYPRAEQAIRARAFGQLGLLDPVDPGALSPAEIVRRVHRALAGGRREAADRFGGLDFDGAARAAEALRELAVARPLAATGTGGGM